MTRTELEAKKMAEIRTIMAGQGMSFRRTEKKTELIDRLLTVSLTAQPEERQDKKPVVLENTLNTKESIIESVQHISGLKLRFENNCWFMRKGVREDSGNINIPLNVIIRCAQKL